MTKRVLIAFLLLSLGVWTTAFEWPVEKVFLTATFGEQRGDHFHSGLDLGGGSQKIKPIAPGELVFAYEYGRDYTTVPVGLGSFLVMHHQGGIRSMYCHLEEQSMERGKVLFGGQDVIGVVGDSGYSLGKHLHLTIIDSEMSTVINPLLLLPTIADRQAPIIKQIVLHDSDQHMELPSRFSLQEGEMEVLAEIYDLREDVGFIWKIAPYQISLYQDGRQISSFVFDALETQAPDRKHRTVLAGSQMVLDDIYVETWLYRLGRVKLLAGETTLLIVTRDFGGNEASREVSLTVAE
jgi:hypothetical protein